ncbi:MAG: ribosomal-protein-alanine N-acetyltransferase, partial [Candidatus Azotimanducaceae bacterium]
MPASKLSDLLIPRIQTERLVVTLLRPSFAELMVRFRQENRGHLGPWEPLRTPQFYTASFWQAQLQANLIDF